MAEPEDASQGSADACILLIGEGSLADSTQRALHSAGASVARLRTPGDDDIREALDEEVDSVVIVSKDDHLSLRLALVIENVRPGVALIATVHGRIVAAQLQRVVENARVLSRADIVAPALAAACFEEDLLLVRPEDDGFSGVYSGEGQRELKPVEPSKHGVPERLMANLGSLFNPFEVSARILMAGLLGFLLVLLIDAVATGLTLGESPVDAFYAVTKTIVTVGPNQDVDMGPAWFKVFSALAMIAALALTAIFTAGVVDRLLDRRLTAMVGSRAVPRKDHVIVVGLGNVGLRLCLLLRDLGVRVLAIESDGDNYNVARAKDYGIPVVLGRGGEPLPAAQALARACPGTGRGHLRRGREHLDRGGRPGHSRGPSDPAARRARRGEQRDAVAVQARHRARRQPHRRGFRGRRGPRLAGQRSLPGRRDGVPDHA